jgi:hypothetical protein
MKKILRQEPYILSGSIVVSANSVTQLIFQISSNFDFLATRFSFKSVSNSEYVIPTFDLQLLRDTYQIFNDYIPCTMFAGMMINKFAMPNILYSVGLANWFKFEKPYLFENKSSVIWNVRDTSGATNIIHIALAGYKNIYSL